MKNNEEIPINVVQNINESKIPKLFDTTNNVDEFIEITAKEKYGKRIEMSKAYKDILNKLHEEQVKTN